MLDSPEYEPEFYINQIDSMEKRYCIIFKKNKLSWKKYYKEVRELLQEKSYWIWVYLVGLEKFIQEEMSSCNTTWKQLEIDRISRVKRIIGDHFKVAEYVRSLQ